MNKQPKQVRAVGAMPTPEEKEAQAKRAFLQKRASLVELIISNAVQGDNAPRMVSDAGGTRPDFRPLVDAAIEAADYIMDKLYGVAVKTDE